MLEVLGDFKSAQLPLEWLLQVCLLLHCLLAWARRWTRVPENACLLSRQCNRMQVFSVFSPFTCFISTRPALHPTQACPRLKPRYFSIASSLAVHPCSAQLAVAIVEWSTPFKRRRRGVCTSWLAALDSQAQVGCVGLLLCQARTASAHGRRIVCTRLAACHAKPQGDVRLPVWVERGALRLPPSPQLPLLMVGPGTGVAPFRSFLQHRQAALLGELHCTAMPWRAGEKATRVLQAGRCRTFAATPGLCSS